MGVTQEEKPPQGPLPVMVAVSSWGFPFLFLHLFLFPNSCGVFQVGECRGREVESRRMGLPTAALLAAPFL